MKKVMRVVAAAALGLGLLGCAEEEGPLEEAGEALDEAAEEMRDAGEKAAEELED